MRMSLLFLLLSSPLTSGCISIAVQNHTKEFAGVTHQVDDAVAAYKLSNGDVVLQLTGTHGEEKNASFWILVPRKRIDEAKREARPSISHCGHPSQCDYWGKKGFDGASWFDPKIRELPAPQDEASQSMEIRHTATNATVFPGRPPPQGVVYVVPTTFMPRVTRVQLVYVEPYSDGYALNWSIRPDTVIHQYQRGWLALTVPADIVTLPLQAIWAGLFLIWGAAGD
jgi:hypothetical protein